MRPDVDLRALPGHRRRQAADLLGLGPWQWPDVGDPRAVATAHTLVPRAGPAPVRCDRLGVIPIVAVTAGGERASVWLLGLEDEAPASLRRCPLAGSALSAWQLAAEAVSRGVPLLWGSLQGAVARRPYVAVLANAVTVRKGCLPPNETHLEGGSYGLALALMMVSNALGLPLPSDVMATAEIDALGNLRPVDFIREKAIAVTLCAPGVRRLLVAPRDAEGARAAARELGAAHLEVVPVPHLTVAISAVWKDDLQTYLVRAGQDRAKRRELVETFFRLIMHEGRSSLRDFTPVRDAIRLARDTWHDLSADELEHLAFSEAVAARHVANEGALAIPTPHVLGAMPHELRLRWIAHVVQQAADTGSPTAEEARALVEPLLVRGVDAFVDHIRLLGAYARLLAVTGEPERALELQEEAAAAMVARMNLDEVSFQLSEWYRLAGALRGAIGMAAYARAEEFDQKLRIHGGPSSDRSGWVGVPRLGAKAWLGLLNTADVETLRAAVTQTSEADDLQVRAARLLAAHLRSTGDVAGLGVVVAEIAARARGGSDWRRAGPLVRLDAALSVGDEAAAGVEVRALTALEPGLVRHLLRAGNEAADYVARFYPY